MARTPIIAGNWKMNNTIAEGTKLVKELAPLVKDAKVTVVVCPTATALAAVADALKGTNIHVGAQNVHSEDHGAFTGEISCPMLNEIGVDYCVLGHSERRGYFGETDEGVNKRAHAAFKAGITPIICCGESLEQREAGEYLDFVAGQVKAALDGFSAEEVGKLVIAYEPIWAIGTGKTASFEQAEEVCAHIQPGGCGQHPHPVRRQREARDDQRPHEAAERRRCTRRRCIPQGEGLQRDRQLLIRS